MTSGGPFDISPPIATWRGYDYGTHTFTPQYTLSDHDVDRIADRIIAKIEERGIEFVPATNPEEV